MSGSPVEISSESSISKSLNLNFLNDYITIPMGSLKISRAANTSKGQAKESKRFEINVRASMFRFPKNIELVYRYFNFYLYFLFISSNYTIPEYNYFFSSHPIAVYCWVNVDSKSAVVHQATISI